VGCYLIQSLSLNPTASPGQKDPGPLSIGYYAGGAIMFAGGLVAWFFGVNAERKSLEDIATPLSAARRSSTLTESPAAAH
jgi:hypothetical protein